MNGHVDSHRLKQLFSRGEAHLAQKDLDAAEAAFKAVLVDLPSHAMAGLRLSTLATVRGRYRDALAHLLGIWSVCPQDPHLLALLAGMFHRMGESRTALDCVAHLEFDGSIDLGLVGEMASLASQLDDVQRSETLLDRLDAMSGPSPYSLYLRATARLFQGRLTEAEETLEACIALAPGFAQAHWSLSRLRRQSQDNNHLIRLQHLLSRHPRDGDAARLGFALAKELDDLGRYDEAWSVLMAACEGKRHVLSYRHADDDEAFECLKTLCRQDFLREQASTIGIGPVPIFVVGLPRTGTTLLERMLGRHPLVKNAGELDDFPLQLRWCCDRFSKSFLDAEVFRVAETIDYAELGRRYLEHTQWRACGKPFFTDKMPLNFLHAGFIHKALPEARMLHMTRHPMDACLSNLKELFAQAYPYSYDLSDIFDYYHQYRQLMAHWHEVLPGRVLDVPYEDLVADPIGQGRRIFSFCGLDWRDEYADIEKNTAPVTTASSVQVRQPIHARAVGQWKHYRRQLDPLRRKLVTAGYLGEEG